MTNKERYEGLTDDQKLNVGNICQRGKTLKEALDFVAPELEGGDDQGDDQLTQEQIDELKLEISQQLEAAGVDVPDLEKDLSEFQEALEALDSDEGL